MFLCCVANCTSTLTLKLFPAGAFMPSEPDDSEWQSTADGRYRLYRCPARHVLVRSENAPILDRCVPCPPYTYSVDLAEYGEKLFVEQGQQISCNRCPRGKAECVGKDDISPLPGFWSPLSTSSQNMTDLRRDGTEHETNVSVADLQGSRVIEIYRCYPPTGEFCAI